LGGNRISGSIVVSNFGFTATADSTFFSMTEFDACSFSEPLQPTTYGLTSTATGQLTQVNGSYTAFVVLQGGILRVGPITNATIASMFFDAFSHSYSLGPRPGSDTILLKGRANGTTIDGFTIRTKQHSK
jgi:hypothetical protein